MTGGVEVKDRVAALFIARSRSLLGDEYRTKLRRTLDALPENVLWWRPNEHSNSIGNLMLHLAGNVRQWIVGGVGRQPGARDRAAEFAAAGGRNRDELWSHLEAALRDADAVLERLRPEELIEPRTIQGRDVTVLDAVYHVVEHFGMHAGQIILLAKAQVPGAIRFYEDAGGVARPLWKEGGEGFGAPP